MAHDVFISYAEEDKPIADAVCAGLEETKAIRCWIAPRDALIGQKYSKSIVEAIRTCEIFVLIFSSNSNKSKFVHVEVEKAFKEEKVIIPFRIEECLPNEDIELFINMPHWLDALTTPLENHIKKLAATIKKIINQELNAVTAGNVNLEYEQMKHPCGVEFANNHIAQIELKPSYSFTKQDLFLQLMIWVPAFGLAATFVYLFYFMQSKMVALKMMIGVAVPLIVIAVLWFFKPLKKIDIDAGSTKYSLDRPNQSIKIHIDSRIGWRDTSLKIEPNVRYYFYTEGEIRHSAFSGKHDANGNPAPISPRSKLKGAKHFNVGALVGKTSRNGTPFLVGASGKTHEFESEGRLYLAINDWPRFDNQGYFSLVITRIKKET